MFHVSTHIKKQYDDWFECKSDAGAMVAMCRCGYLKSMCARELIPHNAVWMQSVCIGQFGY